MEKNGADGWKTHTRERHSQHTRKRAHAHTKTEQGSIPGVCLKDDWELTQGPTVSFGNWNIHDRRAIVISVLLVAESSMTRISAPDIKKQKQG